MPLSLSRWAREAGARAVRVACVATVVAVPGLAFAQTGEWALRPALHPLAGYGMYPREAILGQGGPTASRHFLGLAFDWPIGQRVMVTPSVARTIQVFGCSLCDATGNVVAVVVQTLLTSRRARWGVLVGPAVEHTTLGTRRVGVGAAVAAVVIRGVGPRLMLRHSFLTGPHPSSYAAEVSVRLGR
jgi:hypothetical protein